MEIIWYAILLLVVSIYFILDGYDFGVGIIHLFIPKTNAQKELVAKTAGLFWDFNEVWLVVLGGLLFMAFPVYYASVFSGFYLPLMILLWLIIFRGIGIELRHQFKNEVWQGFWDKSFGISSLLLALFSGAALGNLVRGVNMGEVADGVSTGEPQYFFLPLWNESFSPLVANVGVLDWFTLLIGILAVFILTIHGANWIILKTNSDLIPQLKKLVFRLNWGVSALLIISLAVWNFVREGFIEKYLQSPWLLIFPTIFAAGYAMQFHVQKIHNSLIPFLGSSAMIFGGISASFIGMFPVILPSNNKVNAGLSIYNTATSDYGFSVGIVWFIIGLILALAYFVVQKRILSGKIDHLPHHS